MISLSLLPKNNDELIEEEDKNKERVSIFDKTDFNAFNSALFISEFQGKEEYSSENINKENINELSNSNKKKENNKDLNLTYSLENCLTNELLDIIVNDSNNSKKDKTLYKNEEIKENNIENNNKYESINRIFNTQNSFKINNNLLYQPNIVTKEKNNNLFKLKGNNKKNVYEESINGFEYQLKFIENSLHNVLPKSYKKSQNNIINYNSGFNKYISNFYNNKRVQQMSSFIYPNKFNNINNSNYISSFYENEINNNYNIVSPFISNSNNDSFFNYLNNNNRTYSSNNRIKYQTHKLKINNIKNFEWRCNYCNNINMGYRQTCLNCRNNKKAKF